VDDKILLEHGMMATVLSNKTLYVESQLVSIQAILLSFHPKKLLQDKNVDIKFSVHARYGYQFFQHIRHFCFPSSSQGSIVAMIVW
jgi:hypothetical protein